MTPSLQTTFFVALTGAALAGCGARSALSVPGTTDAGVELPDGGPIPPDGGPIPTDGGPPPEDGGIILPAECSINDPPPASSCGPLTFKLGTQATCAIDVTGAVGLDAEGNIHANQCGPCAGVDCEGPLVCGRVLSMSRHGSGHVLAWCDGTTLVKLLDTMSALPWAAQSPVPNVASIGSMFPCPPIGGELPGVTHLGSSLPSEYELDPGLLAQDWDALVLCGVPDADGGEWQKALLSYVHDFGRGLVITHDYKIACDQTADGPELDALTVPMGIRFLPVHLDWAPLDVDLPCVPDYVF